MLTSGYEELGKHDSIKITKSQIIKGR